MAQKPMLRGEVGARALRVRSVSRGEVWASAGAAPTQGAEKRNRTPPAAHRHQQRGRSKAATWAAAGVDGKGGARQEPKGHAGGTGPVGLKRNLTLDSRHQMVSTS
jgi:hypothetical protein